MTVTLYKFFIVTYDHNNILFDLKSSRRSDGLNVAARVWGTMDVGVFVLETLPNPPLSGREFGVATSDLTVIHTLQGNHIHRLAGLVSAG